VRCVATSILRRQRLVLVALWSPKGGSGTSVLAAACAVVLARHGGVRLADLAGDQPAIFGLGNDPETGLADWLATGPEAPTDALDRLTVAAAPGVALVPRGTGPGPLAPVAEAEAGAALAVALRDGPVPCVVDAGGASTPAARAVVEVADAAVVVMRGCYLSLRRAVRSPLLPRTAGIAFVEEAGRSLGPTELRDVLDRPVLARVPVRANVARAVDAGVVADRLPDPIARAATTLLARLGVLSARRGRAA
jgi:cellulose biosynthesis protein BcsQ